MHPRVELLVAAVALPHMQFTLVHLFPVSVDIRFFLSRVVTHLVYGLMYYWDVVVIHLTAAACVIPWLQIRM